MCRVNFLSSSDSIRLGQIHDDSFFAVLVSIADFPDQIRAMLDKDTDFGILSLKQKLKTISKCLRAFFTTYSSHAYRSNQV